MNSDEIRKVIVSVLDTKPILKGVSPEADFFDLGASSLTVVDLQLQVEEVLSTEVDTALLMATPTLNGWVKIYIESTLAGAESNDEAATATA